MSFENTTSRRSFLSLSAVPGASALAGCASTFGTGWMKGQQPTPLPDPIHPVQIAPAPTDAELSIMYA
jgi:hypothetical protein